MCFSLAWFEQLLVWLVIVCAVIAILKILPPYVLSQLGDLDGGVSVVMAVIRIVVWAIVAIFVIYICFALISCLMSYGGGMPLFPRH